MNTVTTNPSLAEQCAARMWEADNASREAGLRLISVDAGCASFGLTVETRHTNGHGICHGGYIFLLADTAFAFACNSYNQVTVAHTNSITYVQPARLHDALTAEATESARHGRSGIYDVRVSNDNDELIALFRGISRSLGKKFLAEEDER